MHPPSLSLTSLQHLERKERSLTAGAERRLPAGPSGGPRPISPGNDVLLGLSSPRRRPDTGECD